MKKSAALLACFALALSSCAAAPKDTSFKAQLDFENNYITLPLDEYDMSDQALDITYRAYLLILKECYAKKGYDFEILENGLVSGNGLPVRLLEREACGESFYVQQSQRRAGKDL